MILQTLRPSATERQNRVPRPGSDEGRAALSQLLETIMGQTQSRYGLICEITPKADGSHMGRVHVARRSRSSGLTGHAYEPVPGAAATWHDLPAAIRRVAQDGRPAVVADQVRAAPLTVSLPGTPKIRTLAALPVVHDGAVVAVVCLANRPTPYPAAVLERTAPLMTAVSALFQVECLTRDIGVTRARLDMVRTETFSLLDAIADGVMSIDADGKVRSLNAACETLFGYTPEAVIGQPITMVLPTLMATRDGTWKADSPERMTTDVTARKADGTTFEAELSIRELRTEDGPIFAIVVRDVTERRRTISQLTEQARYMSIAERVGGVGHWRIDAGSSQCFWSDHIYHIHGVTPETYTPELESAIAFFHPDDREEVSRCVAEAMETGTTFEFVRRLVQPSGDVRTVFSRGECFLNETGETETILGIFQDVTDQHLLRRDFDRQKSDLDFLFNAVPCQIWLRNAEREILRLNREAARFAGIDMDTAVGRTIHDLVPDAHPAYLTTDDQVIESGDAVLGRIEHLTQADGRQSWIRTDKVPYTDPISGARHVLAVSLDITSEYETSQALLESERRFTTATNIANVGIWDWPDLGKPAQWWSPTIHRMLGYDPGEIDASFETFASLLHTDDRAASLEALDRHLETGTPYRVEYRLRCKRGIYRWFLGSGEASRDTAGRVSSMIGSIQDIHDLRVAQDTLRRNSERLERANHDLDHFAYIASHDLRAPLRGMDSLAEWIIEDIGSTVPQSARDKLDMLRRRIDRMDRLLSDILAYSRAGKRESAPEKIDCNRLLAEIVEWENPPDSFDIETDGSLPSIMASRTLMEQVLSNLVANVVKHHDRQDGRAVLSYRQSKTLHHFTLTDDGPGIPEKFHGRIFKMFQTLRPRDEIEGSGIGLAIVKRTVESAGGTVTVTSPVTDRGTAIAFTLPIIEPFGPHPEGTGE